MATPPTAAAAAAAITKPADFVPLDTLFRVSLIKPPTCGPSGLVLVLALHNDLGTRVARAGVAVTVAWTESAAANPRTTAAPVSRSWTSRPLDLDQFSAAPLTVPGIRSLRGINALSVSVGSRSLEDVARVWDKPADGSTDAELEWTLPLHISFTGADPVFSRRFGSVTVVEPSAFAHTPLGSSVWDGALVLAGFLGRSPAWRRRVAAGPTLELGAGCGFLGRWLASTMPAAAAKSLNFVMTDLPDVMDYCRSNAPAAIACHAFTWGEENTDVAGAPWWADFAGVKRDGDGPLVLVGSDLIYNEKVHPALLAAMRALAAGREAGTVMLMSFKRRSPRGELAFLDQCRRGAAGPAFTRVALLARTAEVYVVSISAGPAPPMKEEQ
ncbi:hypothetical protein H9P43_007526 [Blastocladiella emersonii ATCC 22665]|nr:hypothetical protein H9P43_007526 [Blastocladiella emersonii ATCC 22665]